MPPHLSHTRCAITRLSCFLGCSKQISTSHIKLIHLLLDVCPTHRTSKLLGLAFTPFTKSPEEGAQTSIHLASSPEVEGLTSKYWSDCKAVPSNAASYDTDAAARLWQISEELTAVTKARVLSTV